MLKTRLIPVLLLQSGHLVRSEAFNIHQIIGDPFHEAERFNQWQVDELIYLDITQDQKYQYGRIDREHALSSQALDILSEVSKRCFMPLTWGGSLRTFEEVQEVFSRGADKVAINTQAFEEPALIKKIASQYGNQAVVVSIDAMFNDESGKYEVCINGGKERTGITPEEWASKAETFGAGEILLQSIDRDGKGSGYDVELINRVSHCCNIPLIACSGAGMYEHYVDAIEAGASAVAAANLWHFKELADRGGRRALQRAGINVRI